ncbi:phosphotransferase [Desulfobulbus sp. F5]|nr:phosphotransferase [Desulfobulbus sp. F5]
MNKQYYLGHVRKDDPLYDYLRHEIQPLINEASKQRPEYRVFRLNASNDVFLYEEKYSGAKIIGKFFLCSQNRDAEKATERLNREFDSLCALRDCGLTGYPHHVARPLGRNYALNALLVTENCEGELLSKVILAAIHNGEQEQLFRKLTALGYFLATLHNRTAVSSKVDFHHNCKYMNQLISKLLRIGGIGKGEADELHWLRDQWRQQARMWEDQKVLVHGDATPDNFIIGSGLNITGFDLERSQYTDRVFDVGRIAGELKHFFLRATGDRQAAEPFIGHFLWEYSCHFPNRNSAFRSITSRVPFYMGITLLRIARNSWVSREYRRCLINEAKECLRRY